MGHGENLKGRVDMGYIDFVDSPVIRDHLRTLCGVLALPSARTHEFFTLEVAREGGIWYDVRILKKGEHHDIDKFAKSWGRGR